MAKKLAIPEDRREWPDWEFRPFPKWVGRDELGNDLIANNAAEVEEMTPQVAFPMPLGYNAKGQLITALHPDEYQGKKNQVVKPLESKPEVAEAVAETTTVAEKTTKKNKAA